MRDKYDKECTTLEDNATYTAETHHTIALRNKWLGAGFQVVPACAAAVLGTLVGSGAVPSWLVWLSVAAAVVAAVGGVLNPLKEYYDHLNAAKNFTAFKHDARALRDTFSSSMSDEEYAATVRALHDRYSDLVRFAPPTEKKAFEKARARVQAGVHEPDSKWQLER